MLNHLELVHNKLNPDQRIKYYHTAQQFKVFTTNDASKLSYVAEFYEKLLADNQTKVDGLVLVLNVLKDCPSQFLVEEAPKLMPECIKILQSIECSQTKGAALCVLAALASRCRSLPEMKQELAKGHIPKIVSWIVISLVEESSNGILATLYSQGLKTLVAIMEAFPGSCTPYKKDLEKFLVKQIATWDGSEALQDLAAAFSLLPLCSGKSEVSTFHGDLLAKLLCSLQLTLQQLLTEEQDLEFYLTSEKEGLDLPYIEVDSFEAQLALSNRFIALATVLAHLIESIWPPSSLPVDGLVGLIRHVLSQNLPSLILRRSSQTLAMTLLHLQYASLTLLRSIISSCHTALQSWSNDLLDDLVHVLNWASESDTPTIKHFVTLRCQVYEIMKLLGQHTSTTWDEAKNALLTHLLSDITEKELSPETFKQKPPPATRKRMLGSDSAKPTESLPFSSRSSVDSPTSDCRLLCYKALLVLDQLVVNTLPWEIRKKILTAVIAEAVHLQSQGHFYLESNSSIYGEPRCRKQLYVLLESATFGPEPFLQNGFMQQRAHKLAALSLLHAASQDPHPKVSSFCKKALRLHGSGIVTRPPPPLQENKEENAARTRYLRQAEEDEEFTHLEEEEEEEEEEDDVEMDEEMETEALVSHHNFTARKSLPSHANSNNDEQASQLIKSDSTISYDAKMHKKIKEGKYPIEKSHLEEKIPAKSRLKSYSSHSPSDKKLNHHAEEDEMMHMIETSEHEEEEELITDEEEEEDEEDIYEGLEEEYQPYDDVVLVDQPSDEVELQNHEILTIEEQPNEAAHPLSDPTDTEPDGSAKWVLKNIEEPDDMQENSTIDENKGSFAQNSSEALIVPEDSVHDSTDAKQVQKENESYQESIQETSATSDTSNTFEAPTSQGIDIQEVCIEDTPQNNNFVPAPSFEDSSNTSQQHEPSADNKERVEVTELITDPTSNNTDHQEVVETEVKVKTEELINASIHKIDYDDDDDDIQSLEPSPKKMCMMEEQENAEVQEMLKDFKVAAPSENSKDGVILSDHTSPASPVQNG